MESLDQPEITQPLYKRLLRSDALKRVFDIAGSSCGLALCAPLMLSTALLIRATMGSPVLFRQKRGGYKGQVIDILKFRTMLELCDEQGKLLPDEQRITRLGKFLRSTSIDELPELINVLKGDLSLVGPRPFLAAYLERYSPTQARRHEVKPGITGWAQITGRNTLSWEEKFERDLWYVDNRDFLLDCKIIALTIWKMLKRENINADGHATMPEFMGNTKSKDHS
jgi:lipopolysaccharide/colanic/teichoic acid biosynthesis glycosyltransferase